MEEPTAKRTDRIGLVATDPLRVLGLQTILPQFEIIHLTAPGALDDVNLSLVLVDADVPAIFSSCSPPSTTSDLS